MFGADIPAAARLAIALVIFIGLIGAAAWMVRRFGAQRLGGMTRARSRDLS
jgi:flagellar biogenesis protein FliO